MIYWIAIYIIGMIIIWALKTFKYSRRQGQLYDEDMFGILLDCLFWVIILPCIIFKIITQLLFGLFRKIHKRSDTK